jgi:hypothetical protein
MAFFFAAETPHVLSFVILLLSILLILVCILVLIFFAEVLRELASWSVFAVFTTAPPHLTSIL